MANFNTVGFTAKPRNPVYLVGKQFRTIPARAALVAANLTNNDTVTLAGPFTFADRIDQLFTPNASPALTSSVSNLGFMTKDSLGNLAAITTGGATVLWNGVATLATAQSTRDLLLTGNSALNTTQNIGELLGLGADQEPANGVFLVLGFPTKPSADGTLDLRVVVEEATTN